MVPGTDPPASNAPHSPLCAVSRAMLPLLGDATIMISTTNFTNATSSKGGYITTLLSLEPRLVVVTPWSNPPASTLDMVATITAPLDPELRAAAATTITRNLAILTPQMQFDFLPVRMVMAAVGGCHHEMDLPSSRSSEAFHSSSSLCDKYSLLRVCSTESNNTRPLLHVSSKLTSAPPFPRAIEESGVLALSDGALPQLLIHSAGAAAAAVPADLFAAARGSRSAICSTTAQREVIWWPLPLPMNVLASTVAMDIFSGCGGFTDVIAIGSQLVSFTMMNDHAQRQQLFHKDLYLTDDTTSRYSYVDNVVFVHQGLPLVEADNQLHAYLQNPLGTALSPFTIGLHSTLAHPADAL